MSHGDRLLLASRQLVAALVNLAKARAALRIDARINGQNGGNAMSAAVRAFDHVDNALVATREARAWLATCEKLPANVAAVAK